MWIDEYREKYGLELDDMARRVNVAGRKMRPRLTCTVTDTLIHILERSKTPRTHPRIADAIAIACGATAEQRDSIVDEKHRGTFDPSKYSHITKQTVNQPVKPEIHEYKPGGEHAVVKVDHDGNIIRRYKSLTMAAYYEDNMTREAIRARCRRRVRGEFGKWIYTYRFAEEWDKMTRIEKLRDLGVKISE